MQAKQGEEIENIERREGEYRAKRRRI